MAKVRKRSTKKARRKPESILDRAEPISFDEEGLKIALYGESGTGKTTFWSSFPKPILAIVCSGGKRSGELRSVADVDGIDKIELDDPAIIPQLCEEILESEKYNTVVLDHVTYMYDKVLSQVRGVDDVPVQKTWGMATQQEYGEAGIRTKECLRHLIELPCNVVIVAQQRFFDTDNDNDLILPNIGAAVSPSVVGWLNPAVDYIFQTYIRNHVVEVVKKDRKGNKIVKKRKGEGVDYCLRTGPNEVYTTKFRLPKGKGVPESIIDPDYDKVLEILN